MTYYNENDRYAAQWLRNLIAAGHISDGMVDDRPIQEVRTADLAGYERCHFFAGIAGWDLALRLAGWVADTGNAERWPVGVTGQDGRNRPDSRRQETHGESGARRQVCGQTVWTGSCPCQPFSVAGKRRGTADDRHLWPVWRDLIAECRPSVIFGEQVASKDGRVRLAGVRADLEALGYAVGAADLCAASIGAPHIRQRLWWVAYSERGTAERQRLDMAGTPRGAEGEARQRERIRDDIGDGGDVGGLGDTGIAGPQGRRLQLGQESRQRPPWASGAALACTDGVSRRVEPGIFPLAHGVLGRVGQLRAAGNAIVPQVAAEFVMAFMESIDAA